jgi:hypothetical protein
VIVKTSGGLFILLVKMETENFIESIISSVESTLLVHKQNISIWALGNPRGYLGQVYNTPQGESFFVFSALKRCMALSFMTRTQSQEYHTYKWYRHHRKMVSKLKVFNLL